MNPWIVVAIVGLVLGAGTFAVIPGKVRGGIFLTMLIGAIAALAMTWLGWRVGLAMPGHTFGFFVTVIGTGLILAVWRGVMGRPPRT